MPAVVLLSLVTAQRLAELWLARRNTAALIARGAFEVAPRHYPLIVLLHALWLSGLWIIGWAQPVSLAWLTVYLALQVLRAWTLLTLGPALDDADHRPARRPARHDRPVPVCGAPQLSRGCR